MSNLEPMNFYEIQAELISDETNVGTCIGIWNSKSHKWRFSIYLGHGKVLMLYEKGLGINKELFDRLTSMKVFTKDAFMKDSILLEKSIKLDDLDENLKFDIYRMNIFTIPECQPTSLMNVLKFNLSQIETFEEGDIIKFERKVYSHQALLTDSSRMIVTHRSGEPENPVGPYVASRSIIGLPSDKASVTEDFVIEVAGYRRMLKSNELYDSLHLPRPREEIVKEAKRRIGEQGYSIMSRNCHHFVSECRNGTSYSPEVQSVVSGVVYFSSALLVGAAALLAAKFIGNSDNRSSNRQQEQQRNT